ncbi:MAG: hypothetical protein QG573_1421 [Acidobacteriota bacterium]|nr:hypothetical protein [Acidobacteriota bacterium]
MAKTVERKEEEKHPGDEQGEDEARAQARSGERVRRAQVRNRDARRSRQSDLEGLAAVAAVPAGAVGVRESALEPGQRPGEAGRRRHRSGLVERAEGHPEDEPVVREREFRPFEREERMHLEEEVGGAGAQRPAGRLEDEYQRRGRAGFGPDAHLRRPGDARRISGQGLAGCGEPGRGRRPFGSGGLAGRAEVEGELGGMGNALRAADEIVEARQHDGRLLVATGCGPGGIRRDRRDRRGRRDRGDQRDRSERIDHLLFVAEAHQAAGQVVALRRGEEENCAGERGGAREVDPGRVSGVAAVLPIDMPAGLKLEFESEADGISDQARARLGVLDPGTGDTAGRGADG